MSDHDESLYVRRGTIDDRGCMRCGATLSVIHLSNIDRPDEWRFSCRFCDDGLPRPEKKPRTEEVKS